MINDQECTGYFLSQMMKVNKMNNVQNDQTSDPDVKCSIKMNLSFATWRHKLQKT